MNLEQHLNIVNLVATVTKNADIKGENKLVNNQLKLRAFMFLND